MRLTFSLRPHLALKLCGILPFQPVQDRLVGLFGFFLLDPVTVIEIDDFHIGHELCQVRALVIASRSP